MKYLPLLFLLTCMSACSGRGKPTKLTPVAAVDYVQGTELRLGYVPPDAIIESKLIVDLAGCPGLLRFGETAKYPNEELMMSNDNTIFAQAFGPRDGKSTRTLVFYDSVQDRCRSTDLLNGDIFDWCTPGPDCAQEAPTDKWKGLLQ